MRSRSLAVAVAVVALAGAAATGDAAGAALEPESGDHAGLAEGQRLFYNGRYEESAAIASASCADEDPGVDLAACELRSSALLFQIKRALPKGMKKQDAFTACASCPDLMTAFRAVTLTAQQAARDRLKTMPQDDETRFLLGKIDLNHVWLHLGLIGRRTGWKEYWEARRALDAVLKANPRNVRAQVSRAWIDYIVDTQAPRGTRWLLGGGDKARGLRVVEDAAVLDEEPFVRAEAGFALWDMRVREGNIAGAVTIAQELVRDFPDNQELHRFLAEQAEVALR